tara:strand:+ start:114653 stop:114913 length:261 start_codon:yes stop_codon:yes gene_type:complete
MNPYTETQIDTNTYLRTFCADTPEEDLIWHLDKEDRVIEATHFTDWKFQFDNQLPISLNNTITIKKNTFHRIIKGNEDCELRIIKL